MKIRKLSNIKKAHENSGKAKALFSSNKITWTTVRLKGVSWDRSHLVTGRNSCVFVF